MELVRSPGEALFVATMEGRGYIPESLRAATATAVPERRPPPFSSLFCDKPVVMYEQLPLGPNALAPPDVHVAPPPLTLEVRHIEKCVRQIMVGLFSNLCHRIWDPLALQEPAWMVPEGKHLDDFVPAPFMPALTATAAALLGSAPPLRTGSTDWMDSYAALLNTPFQSFLSAIIKGAPTTFSTLVLCHYYLECAAAQGLLAPLQAQGVSPRLIVLTYLSLAAKYALDNPGSCRTWGRLSGVPPMVVAETELKVLSVRKFDFFAAPSDIFAHLNRLKLLTDQITFAGGMSAAATTVPAPVLTSVPMASTMGPGFPGPLPVSAVYAPSTSSMHQAPAVASIVPVTAPFFPSELPPTVPFPVSRFLPTANVIMDSHASAFSKTTMNGIGYNYNSQVVPRTSVRLDSTSTVPKRKALADWDVLRRTEPPYVAPPMDPVKPFTVRRRVARTIGVAASPLSMMAQDVMFQPAVSALGPRRAAHSSTLPSLQSLAAGARGNPYGATLP
jgi:hypothetical protein